MISPDEAALTVTLISAPEERLVVLVLTVIIYKKGVEVDRKVGGVPESHMKEFLDKNI